MSHLPLLRVLSSICLSTALFSSAACGPVTEPDQPAGDDEVAALNQELHGARGGAVYSMTNDSTRNAVTWFQRAGDGSLTLRGLFYTGGRGTGAGLGNQGAVTLSEDGRWLFAVDAGSNEVTSFRVLPYGLALADHRPSGGASPISVTAHGSVVYVLNGGGAGNIAGFTRGPGGGLAPIAGSARPLSAAAPGPAQISFNPAGDQLVVTEKGTNNIDTYAVDRAGRASAPRVQASAGRTPFGFAFDSRGRLFVSEAFGGGADASAVSSYRLSGGALSPVTASAPTTETAACWAIVSPNGRYVYTTNTGSGTVTGFAISASGALTRLAADGVSANVGTGSGPIDAAFAGRYLYVLAGGTSEIHGFAVQGDGGLRPLGAPTSLPAGANGLAGL